MKSENPFAKTVQSLAKEHIQTFNNKRFTNNDGYYSNSFNRTTKYIKIYI
jgi:hypothetical protein